MTVTVTTYNGNRVYRQVENLTYTLGGYLRFTFVEGGERLPYNVESDYITGFKVSAS